MLSITSCTECQHVKICKHQEDYREEVEILLVLQNKFTNGHINIECRNYQKVIPQRRGEFIG